MHDAYKIKKAGPKDCADIAKVHVNCWRTTYSGIVPDEKLQSMSVEKSTEKWKEFFERTPSEVESILLLKKGAETIGFCAGGLKRKESKRTAGYTGEIKALYILQEHQKKGIGTEFLKLYEEIFRKNGIYSYIIWVLKDNPSKEFYKKRNGRLITTKTYDIAGKKLKGLCYGFKLSNGN